MARLSDFQNHPSRGRNLAAEALVDRNAQAIHRNLPHFSETRIDVGEGYAERIPIPYMRDAAMREVRLHRALDALCSIANITVDEAEPLHARLDKELLVHEPGEGLDEEESTIVEDDGEENEKPEHIKIPAPDMHHAIDMILDVMERRPKKTRRTSHDAGFITDSDYIAKYLNPDQLCVETENKLRPLVLATQEDCAARGYWAGLFDFLHSQPEGSRIRDCRKATLSMLIGKTIAAV